MTERHRIELPTNSAGDPMPYDVIMGADGEPEIGPSIDDLVAEDASHRAVPPDGNRDGNDDD